MGGNAPDKPFYERVRAYDDANIDHAATRKRLEKQNRWLTLLDEGDHFTRLEEVSEAAGYPHATVLSWRKLDQVFAKQYAKANELLKNRRKKIARTPGPLVVDRDKPLPPDMPFADWRRHYLGRATPPHHQWIVQAWEDKTNNVVVVLAPPGAGKDTTCGDLLAKNVCYNRSLRAAWFMESETFSRRRIAERIVPYLTDKNVYKRPPLGSDSTKPEGSLIADFGPFKWRPGMVDQGGNPVVKTTWTKNEIYFVHSDAPEADPNLWASGIEGATYGSRIDELYGSDWFTVENQRSPTTMDGQLAWVFGTAFSRLDDRGRALIMGTRVKRGDNYERMLDKLIGDAPVIHQDGYYTKYGNGVATIIVPAIQHDSDGNEVSYWPGRFSLRSYMELPNGDRRFTDEIDEDELHALAAQGASRVRGLYEIRAQDPVMFETMYQQNPPADATGDFSDVVLETACDDTRTYEVAYPDEVVIVGADPARTAGAAWAALAVSREKGTVTVIDTFFGTNLGITGIKQKLVLHPLAKWAPLYYGYEINKEAAVLDDTLIKQAFSDFSTTLYRHQTHSANRSVGDLSLPSLSFYMRSGILRLPYRTAEDRRRTDTLKTHFQAFDTASHAAGRTRPGQKNHTPDDLAFAVWIAFIKAWKYLEGGKRREAVTTAVPRAVRQKWDRLSRQRRAERTGRDSVRHATPSISDAVSIALQGGQD